jgi:hypothetical protein
VVLTNPNKHTQRKKVIKVEILSSVKRRSKGSKKQTVSGGTSVVLTRLARLLPSRKPEDRPKRTN